MKGKNRSIVQSAIAWKGFKTDVDWQTNQNSGFQNLPKLKAYNRDDLVLTFICDNDFTTGFSRIELIKMGAVPWVPYFIKDPVNFFLSQPCGSSPITIITTRFAQTPIIKIKV